MAKKNPPKKRGRPKKLVDRIVPDEVTPEVSSANPEEGEGLPWCHVTPLGFVHSQYTHDKFVKGQIEFLETMAELWPLAIKRKKAVNENDYAVLSSIDQEQKEIVARANEKLKTVIMHRIPLFKLYEQSPVFKEREDKASKANPVYWINRWCWTFDPRNPPTGISAKLPLVMWPSQAEFIEKVEYWYQNRMNWLAEKSRAWGATWLIAALYVHKWLYTPNFVGGFGSRKEDLVDSQGDPNCLFWKVRYLIYSLPKNMRPKTFEKIGGPNDRAMKLINPDNGSVIIGEGGDNIGAGGRTSMYVVDEAALVERQEKVDASLSFTTDCQGWVSTPRGMNLFGKKRFSGNVQVFTMNWFMDPAKNPGQRGWRKKQKNQTAWYQYQKQMHDEVTIAQEVDIDYAASVEGVFIPSEWVNMAVGFELPEGDTAVAGFDVAGGGKNKSVYTCRRGPVVKVPKVIKYDTPTEAAWKVADFADEDKVSILNYDEDGLGIAVLGTFKTGERPLRFRYNGIHGNSPASEEFIPEEGRTWKEKVKNKRAELWCKIRMRFQKTYEHRMGIKFYSPDEMISIPNDADLIQQLTAPLMKHTGSGKILVESKEEMKSRGIPSPDHADSLVYAFAGEETETKYVSNFDYTENKKHYCAFNVDDNTKAGATRIVSVYQADDFKVSVMCAAWYGSGSQQLLRIFGECAIPNGQPEDVRDFVTEIMEATRRPVDLWLGNKLMFKDIEKSTKCPWYLYKKAGIDLKQNFDFDPVGAVMLLNQMFRSDMIQIHLDCRETMLQIDKWIKSRGDSDGNFGLALALCQLVTYLKSKKLINPSIVKVEYYGGTISSFEKPPAVAAPVSTLRK